jgi:hypothetical protein
MTLLILNHIAFLQLVDFVETPGTRCGNRTTIFSSPVSCLTSNLHSHLYSTETAVLKLLSDILRAVDGGDTSFTRTVGRV